MPFTLSGRLSTVVGWRRFILIICEDTSWPRAAPLVTHRRTSFAKITEPLEVPALLSLQTDSFDWLVGGEQWDEMVAARQGCR